MDNTKIALFKGKKIRRLIHENEWYFSVVDVIEALTDSVKPRVYWNAMKTRVKSQDGVELSTNCRQLKLESSDGKKYETDCANTESERATTEIHRTEDSKGVPKLKQDAKVGGDIAGGARRKLEKKLGKSIVSKENYLREQESQKKLKG